MQKRLGFNANQRRKGGSTLREAGIDATVSACGAGVGIAQRGLQCLFKEYVQGSEEDMKRPRSRGGTGLGLSICSKQVPAIRAQEFRGLGFC